MKYTNQLILTFFIVCFWAFNTNAQKPINSISGAYLIKTNWGGDNFFPNQFIPDNHTPGCHSMAFAQIFYYHNMRPTGEVKYISSKGYKIKENFQYYEPNWGLMKNTEYQDYDSSSIEEVQKYLYYIAAIVQKDFGTGGYMSRFHKKQLHSHFDCKVKEYPEI